MTRLESLSPHGVWPAYFGADANNRTYPQFCKPLGGHKGKGRLEHEWAKHGTCTILSRDGYFEEEKKLSDYTSDIDDILHAFSGDSIELEEIYDAFGGEKRVTVKTDQFCRLEEITSCWSKTPTGTCDVDEFSFLSF
jgi:ribonuclease I